LNGGWNAFRDTLERNFIEDYPLSLCEMVAEDFLFDFLFSGGGSMESMEPDGSKRFSYRFAINITMALCDGSYFPIPTYLPGRISTS